MCRLKDTYLRWFELAREGLALGVENRREYRDVERVVITGMGGSGIAGDLVVLALEDYAEMLGMVSKDFSIPSPMVNERTLVIAISYSGNTRETLFSLEQALKRSSKACIVASGGKLIEFARSRGIPYVKVREGLAPRLALPQLFTATIKLLKEVGVVDVVNEVARDIEVLRETRSALMDSESLASFLRNARMPLIVASTRYQVLAMRIKNELNENAKMPAKVEIAPELFHNDIVGWERQVFSDRAVIVESDLEHEREYLRLYEEFLDSMGFEIWLMKLLGDTRIAKIMYGSLVAGLASVRIAELVGVDPLVTKSIASYKKFVTGEEEFIRRSLGL